MALKRTPEIDQLFKGILSLESADECSAFLEDLCTVREILDLSQRYSVALLLDKGESYLKISELTGASSATISRVARALNYGEGGYRSIIDKSKRKS